MLKGEKKIFSLAYCGSLLMAWYKSLANRVFAAATASVASAVGISIGRSVGTTWGVDVGATGSPGLSSGVMHPTQMIHNVRRHATAPLLYVRIVMETNCPRIYISLAIISNQFAPNGQKQIREEVPGR